MDKLTKRSILADIGYEESVVFENPDYDDAIIAVDENGRVIYSYEMMAKCLMKEDGMTYEEACEFIDYNTVRSLPYYPNAPIIAYNTDIFEGETKKYRLKNFDAKKETQKCIEWIQEWFNINGPGCNAIVGVSGGKDSTIVAALCAKALGPERVIGISMPDEGQGTNDAEAICEHLGIKYVCIPIDGITGAANFALGLSEDSRGLGLSEQTVQNIPPRVRMLVLYGYSQSHNGRVIGTTNLDERLTGYFTKFGDGLACDVEPIEMLTVGEIIEMGKCLGLPDKWLYKIPSADLPNTKTDEEELGFSYKEFDDYIRDNRELPKETVEKIEKRINDNAFKLKPIEHFMPY